MNGISVFIKEMSESPLAATAGEETAGRCEEPVRFIPHKTSDLPLT